VLPPRSNEGEETLVTILADTSKAHAVRSRAAMKLTYLRRAKACVPIQLTSLRFGPRLSLLHLPAESFIEFQLYAQDVDAKGFVATAAYGDGGPWYIPTADAYPQGGYEPSVAFVDPEAEARLRDGIRKLLG
jgi:hypothetical protein